MNETDALGLGFIGAFATIVAILAVGLVGASIGEGSAIQKGRNQGIIYCVENKQKCMTEYTYLKLKENQK